MTICGKIRGKIITSVCDILFVYVVCFFSLYTYAADAVFPENRDNDILPWEKMTVSYSELLSTDDKIITVNDSEDYVENVSREDNILTVGFKNIDYGKRYKVIIKGGDGETEAIKFFNTALRKSKDLLSFKYGNMNHFWNGRATQGASVDSDANELRMTSNLTGKVGGRINSTEFSINSTDKDEFIINVASQQDVEFKIYFSKVGNNSGFTNTMGSISIEGGNEFREYRIQPSPDDGWDGEIKQLMFEQTTSLENVIRIDSIRIESPSPEKFIIGDFDLYKDYGTETEKKITGENFSGGTVTASVSGVQSEDGKNVLLIIARYKDGIMTGARCVQEDISDGKAHCPITVSDNVQTGETVKAFLRKGFNDIYALKECVVAKAE